MSESYIPPFTMTDDITNLVIDIAELTGRITISEQLSKNPKLRRDNHIKSIHSSLAIEQNSLTLDQVSDVIDGKRVLGPLQDIREVKNAYDAYELMTKLDPYSVTDLLKAHRIMMTGLVKEAAYSIMNLNSYIHLLMVMEEPEDCGIHLYWLNGRSFSFGFQ